jgi:hypothetical protein
MRGSCCRNVDDHRKSKLADPTFDRETSMMPNLSIT